MQSKQRPADKKIVYTQFNILNYPYMPSAVTAITFLGGKSPESIHCCHTSVFAPDTAVRSCQRQVGITVWNFPINKCWLVPIRK